MKYHGNFCMSLDTFSILAVSIRILYGLAFHSIPLFPMKSRRPSAGGSIHATLMPRVVRKTRSQNSRQTQARASKSDLPEARQTTGNLCRVHLRASLRASHY
ncbi:hypothetical protein P280DRAFT_196892 [Massarina eburnea CBS 473.64]|uniref:Uncharacterized protein n=1 Tax=Massarina eburnea CBS 473.64 TaxID=1395130 RepID=A0A6A6RMI2_9PLEO|nr:hypothetical protein P280DRAFT_196892 [Massarina eburnea CBS 473.64]